MAEATNPIATASKPRVGEDVGQQLKAAFRQGVFWGQRNTAYGVGTAPEVAAAEAFVQTYPGLASAPSPEAGAGGDLCAEAVDIVGTIKRTYSAGFCISGELQERMSRFLKLVASTGSGKEETKGEPSGTGSREPGPTVPASGFDPSRVEAAAQAYYDGMIGDERTQWPHHDGWAGKSEAFKSKVRAHMARALDAALGTEARSAETFGLGPKDDGPADLSATPEATPKSSPSQTPVDPQMTVEEAADIVGKLPFEHSPQETARVLRMEAERWIGHRRDDCLARASRIEAALRTLQAAGEVR